MIDPEGSFLLLDNVTKKYGARIGVDTFTVLDNLHLKMQKGDAAAVTGPSGCGKSTLLNLIGALDSPDSGGIRIDGIDLAGLCEDKLAKLRNNDIGFVFQLHHLLPQLTVVENVLVPCLAAQSKVDSATHEWAMALLDVVGLSSRALHFPGELSGGERQRVAVARALINRPKLLLADEPTGALDRSSASKVMDLLMSINDKDKLTLLLVTHDEATASEMPVRYRLLDGALK